MWMKLLVEDCWSSFLSVYCVSYVNVCTYDIALVQLSYVISLTLGAHAQRGLL